MVFDVKLVKATLIYGATANGLTGSLATFGQLTSNQKTPVVEILFNFSHSVKLIVHIRIIIIHHHHHHHHNNKLFQQ